MGLQIESAWGISFYAPGKVMLEWVKVYWSWSIFYNKYPEPALYQSQVAYFSKPTLAKWMIPHILLEIVGWSRLPAKMFFLKTKWWRIRVICMATNVGVSSNMLHKQVSNNELHNWLYAHVGNARMDIAISVTIYQSKI